MLRIIEVDGVIEDDDVEVLNRCLLLMVDLLVEEIVEVHSCGFQAGPPLRKYTTVG